MTKVVLPSAAVIILMLMHEGQPLWGMALSAVLISLWFDL